MEGDTEKQRIEEEQQKYCVIVQLTNLQIEPNGFYESKIRNQLQAG